MSQRLSHTEENEHYASAADPEGWTLCIRSRMNAMHPLGIETTKPYAGQRKNRSCSNTVSFSFDYHKRTNYMHPWTNPCKTEWFWRDKWRSYVMHFHVLCIMFPDILIMFWINPTNHAFLVSCRRSQCLYGPSLTSLLFNTS